MCITWLLNKGPNLHPSQQVRALADWRKTEALAVTSSEVRHWSSTRSIPTSTGRAQSVWSGPASQTSLISSPAVSRPLGLSHCRRYQRAGTTLAVTRSGTLDVAGQVAQFCFCVRYFEEVQIPDWNASCRRIRSILCDRTAQRKVSQTWRKRESWKVLGNKASQKARALCMR